MCGIFGYIGSKVDAADKVFRGLQDIEYRGYDSWGVSLFAGNKFKTVKKVGFLPTNYDFEQSNLALGHTRWATHGGATVENAHPHLSCDDGLVLVHNGIVENYLELKSKLETHTLSSETDSEVIIHLIEESSARMGFEEAVAAVFGELQGLSAIVVSNGKKLIACKIGSPLVVGRSEDGFIIASDPNAILPYTNNLLFLEDHEMVVLESDINLVDVRTLKAKDVKFSKIEWEYTKGDRGEFQHYMLKEIYEQPQILYNQIQSLDSIRQVVKEIKKAHGTYFIGCGSAAYACMLAEYAFSDIAKRHINFSLGSEFNYTADFITDKSLLIAISQSGETIDIVEPINLAKKKGAKVVALTNTLGSTIYRMSDVKTLLNAGPEKAVASTKALIAMMANVLLLAYGLADKLDVGIKVVENSAKEIEKIIKNQSEIERLAEQIKGKEHVYVLGRGISFPVALESALKIKEVSYIHAEGLASGELKHGPIALIDQGTPVILFVPNDETKSAVLANATEVKARGAYVIGVGCENSPVFDYFFEVTDVGASSVLPHIVFAQFLGYFLAVKKNLNPDKPRNLAKSVTVK